MLVLAFVLTKDVNRHLEETLAAAAAKWAFYSAGYLCVFFFSLVHFLVRALPIK